jgi:hypothetical protein
LRSDAPPFYVTTLVSIVTHTAHATTCITMYKVAKGQPKRAQPAATTSGTNETSNTTSAMRR